MSEKQKEPTNGMPEDDELEAADLDKVSGGTPGSTNANNLEDSPGTQTGTASAILKTKHDTVKNSISNVR